MLEKSDRVGELAQRQWNGRHGEIWRYRFVSDVPLRNGEQALAVNWCELVITHEQTGERLYQNAWVTNHPMTAETVLRIVPAGRTRWKIENENNNTLRGDMGNQRLSSGTQLRPWSTAFVERLGQPELAGVSGAYGAGDKRSGLSVLTPGLRRTQNLFQ